MHWGVAKRALNGSIGLCCLGISWSTLRRLRRLSSPQRFDEEVRHKTEEGLRTQAVTDALTGLPNRAAFNERIAGQAGAEPGRVAVLFLDLDRFRMINGTLGHQVGDEVLSAAATRMCRVLRAHDELFRIGGDEFTVLCRIIADDSEALALARRLAGTWAEPFAVDGREMYVSFSIGIAIGKVPEGAPDLMRRADVAMYQAKASGGATERVFDASMSDQGHGLTLFNDLSRALERQEFELDFQPIVRLATAHVVGAEALVRWCHPARGRLLPEEFVPFAEETGQIVALGRWVLQAACTAAAGWIGRPGEAAPYVTVNISAGEVEHPGFLTYISEVLARTRLAPERLWLEITERTAGRDPAIVESRLVALDQTGVRVVLDDFGTGWASLTHLHRFPVRMVKIDRSFVAADPASSGATVVRSIVLLASALNIDCAAEGVETADQMTRLTALGCTLGQGYLLGRPMEESALRHLLRASGWRAPSPRQASA